ncbi:serine hydrolase [Dyella jejuensis]|uniref:Serine hydrolase n=1 Tax=Dyella jejuensis TaxID=1432009 RepID=A0ABW8JLN4_9GAMM
MYAQLTPARLRTGLPASVRLADKCGTSPTIHGLTAAYNDIGILNWPDGHVVIVAAFLTASPATEKQRQALYTELARDVSDALHHGKSLDILKRHVHCHYGASSIRRTHSDPAHEVLDASSRLIIIDY